MKIKNNGFSLLEISIVLIISSILLGISFEAGKFFLLKNNIETTRIKLNTIQDALNIYLIENGKMPCPAGLKNNFGLSLSCMADSTNGVYVKNGIARGGIPFRELNLTSDLSYDAWKTKFTYSVYIESANNNSSPRNFKRMQSDYSAISIYNNSLTDLVTTKALYSIVSHGSNRLGGFDYDNNKINSTINISNFEEINTINSSSFLSNVYFTNIKNNMDTNDDLVRYSTRMQIMYNSDINEVPCYINQTIVNNLILEYNNLNETNIINSSTFSDEFLEYDGIKEKILRDNLYNSYYSLKCYKYGRLGVLKDD